MAELISLARPYARAAFESARDNNQLDEWSESLNLLAAVTADPDMKRVLNHPSLTADQKIEVVVDVCQGKLSEPVRNFIRIMADNRRLELFPAIAELFRNYRSEHERTVDVSLTAAYEVTDEQKEKLSKALSRKLDRSVALQINVDRSIIGGVVIEAGDTVIDASVRGKLNKLAHAIGS